MNVNDTKSKGNSAEKIAEKYLCERKYRILKRNFILGKIGEIDLICEDGSTLVFVEVKSCTNKNFGEPEYFITAAKQKKLRKVAEGYLSINQIYGKDCRFDVIIVNFQGKNYEVKHIVNCI